MLKTKVDNRTILAVFLILGASLSFTGLMQLIGLPVDISKIFPGLAMFLVAVPLTIEVFLEDKIKLKDLYKKPTNLLAALVIVTSFILGFSQFLGMPIGTLSNLEGFILLIGGILILAEIWS